MIAGPTAGLQGVLFVELDQWLSSDSDLAGGCAEDCLLHSFWAL